MTSPDNFPQPSTSPSSAAGTDVLAERATPQPTVLSTVWAGPSDTDEDTHTAQPMEGTGGHLGEPDLGMERHRSRVVGWLFAPATGRRALLITTAASLICGGLLAAGEIDDGAPVSRSAQEQNSDEATQGSLSSRAVVAEDQADGDRASTEPDPVALEALSADARLRLIADPEGDAAGTWMLEAQIVDPVDSAAAVRFTVNGAVVEEVDRAPFRLVLNPELLTNITTVLGEGQPLIVTAAAIWPDDGDAASPATVVLPN